MTPSLSQILMVVAGGALFLWAAPVLGQLPEPEWVDMTSPQKLVVKTLEVAGGTVRVRGGLLVRPGGGWKSTPENTDVDLFLAISNGSPGTLWAEMEIEIPGQKKAVKFGKLKVGQQEWLETWNVKELRWGFHYPVRVSLYSDKNKAISFGSTSTSLVFEQADNANLEQAKALVARAPRVGSIVWVTLSGWPDGVGSGPADSADEMVEGTVADALLQADIENAIRILEAADHPGCEFRIVKRMRSASNLGAERWEVKSCDTTSLYGVSMAPSARGGVDFQVKKAAQ